MCMSQFQFFWNVVHIQQSVRVFKFYKNSLQNLRMECRSTFQWMKIPMGSFQFCDALSILFELEKPPIEHLEGFILLQKKGSELQKNLELLTGNSSSTTWKNSPTRSTKAVALMVGGMFAIAIMSCWGERFIEAGTKSGLLGIIPWCAIATCSVAWKATTMAVA